MSRGVPPEEKEIKIKTKEGQTFYYCYEHNGRYFCSLCNYSVDVEDPHCRRDMSNHKRKEHGDKEKNTYSFINQIKTLRQKVFEMEKQLIGTTKSTTSERKLVEYKTAYLICRKGYSFSNTALVKQILSTIDPYQHYCLSESTLKNRCKEISKYIKSQKYTILSLCLSYSLCLDTTTNIIGQEVLMIYTKVIKNDGESVIFIGEYKVLTGKDSECISKTLLNYINKCGAPISKLSSITSDGAAVMLGRKNGVLSKVINVIYSTLGFTVPSLNQLILKIHCFVHQEALCASILAPNVSKKKLQFQIEDFEETEFNFCEDDVLNNSFSHVSLVVFKLIGSINKTFNARSYLKQLIEKFGYKSLPKHVNVRWLSACKCWCRFYLLRDEISTTLKSIPICSLDKAIGVRLNGIYNMYRESSETVTLFMEPSYSQKIDSCIESIKSSIGDNDEVICQTQVIPEEQSANKKEFSLKKKVETVKLQKALLNIINNKEWIFDCAFLCDISEMLNNLNIKLQGNKLDIFEYLDLILNFTSDLELFITQLKENNYQSFWRTNKIQCGSNKNTRHLAVMGKLLDQFKIRFKENKLFTQFNTILNDPFNTNIDLNDPLIDSIREDIKKIRIGLISKTIHTPFFKNVVKSIYLNHFNLNYPKFMEFGFRVMSAFATSYSCEQGFSRVNYVHCGHRSNLSDKLVKAIITIIGFEEIEEWEPIVVFDNHK